MQNKSKILIGTAIFLASLAGCSGGGSSSSSTYSSTTTTTNDNPNNPNNPASNVDLGPNVIIGSSSNITDLQNKINSVYNAMWNQESGAQFTESRVAILLKPGTYNNLDVKVGYYTQVLGLGTSPDSVHIIGAVRTQDGTPVESAHPDQMPGALNNFWRGAENLSITPTLGSIDFPDPNTVPHNQNVWAVSQASPLRRIDIQNGTLRLFDVGYSSGGFMANSSIDGDVITGSQQQWFARNMWFNNWQPGNWNMVLAGDMGQACFWGPGGWQNNDLDCSLTLPFNGTIESHPFMAISSVPLISEKPFLTIDNNNNYSVYVPALQKDSIGEHFSTMGDKTISINDFFIAYPSTSTSAINSALKSGKNLLLTPGVYRLDTTIVVPNKDQIILGLGIPTLIAPGKGIPAIQVADLDGIKIAGLMVDANIEKGNQPTLIQVGDNTAKYISHANDPIEIYDVYCRIGGAEPGNAGSCMTVNSDNVIGDNLWLWRADHGNGVGWNQNTANNGLIVNGNNVIMYGLAVEHFQQYQTIWKGESGIVMFYQSETPYDVPSQDVWNPSQSENGYASYYVTAKTHHAYGVGVYSNFESSSITLDNAILTPGLASDVIQQALTVWLDGIPGSQISHVYNNQGPAANSSVPGTPQYYN